MLKKIEEYIKGHNLSLAEESLSALVFVVLVVVVTTFSSVTLALESLAWVIVGSLIMLFGRAVNARLVAGLFVVLLVLGIALFRSIGMT